jgi:DNA polymerase-3 subunit beta
MKLSLEKTTFLNVLSHGQGVVEKRTTVPILSHVLLTAHQNSLSVTSTDMDLSLIETIPADVEKSGSIAVSAYMLFEIVRKLSDTKLITLEFKEDMLEVTSGRSAFKLSCLPAEDFPQIAQSELTHQFTLPSPVLKHLIDNTRFSMSTEETRYHLNGIHFHTLSTPEGLMLRAVATDLHRLACVECPAPEEATGMPAIIVGRKTIAEIRKILDEGDAPVNIGVSSTRIEISYENDKTRGALSSRLIDGAFPDYQSALAVANDKVMVVNTKDFAGAVDRVGIIVSDKIRAIRILIGNNAAVLTAVSSDLGSAREDLDVMFPYAESIDICFNVKYLMDIAQQVSYDELEFLLADSDSSVLIRPVGDSSQNFILMPMRV